MKPNPKHSLFIATVALMGLASCGTPRTTVRVINKAEGVQTTVNASTGDGGSTTVTVTPSIQVDSTKIL